MGNVFDDLLARSTGRTDRAETVDVDLYDTAYIDRDRSDHYVLKLKYRNRRFVVVSNGIHPSCFVECNVNDIVKGGFRQSYDRKGWHNYLPPGSDRRFYYGVSFEATGFQASWLLSYYTTTAEMFDSALIEYDQDTDWNGVLSDEVNIRGGRHRWTVPELIEECHRAIDIFLDGAEEKS